MADLFDLFKSLVVPGVILAALAVLTARRGKPEAIGALLGFVAAIALVFLAYLGSSTTDPGCSDCSEVWGRWWEPGLVIFWLGLLLFAWIGLAALVSAFSRGRGERSRPS